MNVCAFSLFGFLFPCQCKWRVAPPAAACHSLLQQIIADFCAQIFTAKSGDDWAEWQLLLLLLLLLVLLRGRAQTKPSPFAREKRETKDMRLTAATTTCHSDRHNKTHSTHIKYTHNETLARRQVSQHTHTHTHMAESGSSPLAPCPVTSKQKSSLLSSVARGVRFFISSLFFPPCATRESCVCVCVCECGVERVAVHMSFCKLIYKHNWHWAQM